MRPPAGNYCHDRDPCGRPHGFKPSAASIHGHGLKRRSVLQPLPQVLPCRRIGDSRRWRRRRSANSSRISRCRALRFRGVINPTLYTCRRAPADRASLPLRAAGTGRGSARRPGCDRARTPSTSALQIAAERGPRHGQGYLAIDVGTVRWKHLVRRHRHENVRSPARRARACRVRPRPGERIRCVVDAGRKCDRQGFSRRTRRPPCTPGTGSR